MCVYGCWGTPERGATAQCIPEMAAQLLTLLSITLQQVAQHFSTAAAGAGDVVVPRRPHRQAHRHACMMAAGDVMVPRQPHRQAHRHECMMAVGCRLGRTLMRLNISADMGVGSFVFFAVSLLLATILESPACVTCYQVGRCLAWC